MWNREIHDAVKRKGKVFIAWKRTGEEVARNNSTCRETRRAVSFAKQAESYEDLNTREAEKTMSRISMDRYRKD